MLCQTEQLFPPAIRIAIVDDGLFERITLLVVSVQFLDSLIDKAFLQSV